MPEEKSIIGIDEHVFIGGQNGTGKTWAARKYLANYDQVVVHDTKGLITWPEIPGTRWGVGKGKTHRLLDGGKELTVVTRLQDIVNVKTPKIIYRPIWQELHPDYYNAFYEWCYRRQNCIVWVDEAFSISPNPFVIPEYARAILTRGRERLTPMWSLSQRPSGISQLFMSEAKHFFVYNFQLKQDRAKMVEMTGSPLLDTKPGKYKFWYFNVEHDAPVLGELVEARRKEVKTKWETKKSLE